MKRRVWTDIEVAVLRKFYADTPAPLIADVLARPASSVYQKAKSLGLAKSPAFYASEISGRTDGHRGSESRFSKGHEPWNKGKKGSTGHHPNTRRTQFKKGAMAGAAQHNYVPIGTTRVTRDGILERKVTDDPALYPARRWVPVTRLVWEAAHGPVPAKHVVRFNPGMHTTVESENTLDRLECISLAENMRRNTLHRYPKEIVDAIRSRGVLNRRINHVEKHQRSA